MRWQNGYIAVDWGTTNRRAYRLSPAGQVLDQVEDALGILSVPKGTFADAVAQLRARLGALPLLLAGMIGSNLGWKETPYVECPAGLPELKQAILWVEPDIAISPGVRFTGPDKWDVMRGEELQVLGAVAAGLVSSEATICHPGTHTKWARVSDSHIASFRTAMTGEMFDLLRKHSILAGAMQKPAQNGAQFVAGVRRALERTDLLGELFGVRARSLLERQSNDATPDFSAFVSGLLIGSDVREAVIDVADDSISVVGEPRLTGLYAEAIAIAGNKAVEIDGAKAFLAGANALVETF